MVRLICRHLDSPVLDVLVYGSCQQDLCIVMWITSNHSKHFHTRLHLYSLFVYLHSYYVFFIYKMCTPQCRPNWMLTFSVSNSFILLLLTPMSPSLVPMEHVSFMHRLTRFPSIFKMLYHYHRQLLLPLPSNLHLHHLHHHHHHLLLRHPHHHHNNHHRHLRHLHPLLPHQHQSHDLLRSLEVFPLPSVLILRQVNLLLLHQGMKLITSPMIHHKVLQLYQPLLTLPLLQHPSSSIKTVLLPLLVFLLFGHHFFL